MSEIKIKMIKTAKPDFSFMLHPEEKDMILIIGHEYAATTNQHGAICGICDNGKQLGVRPGEFEFVEAPAWVLEKHGKLADLIGRDIPLSKLKTKE